MSDLHQYELHYAWAAEMRDVEIMLTRLVWAHSVQEAVFQLELEVKRGNYYAFKIVEAGPVKKAHYYGAGTHFHVCTDCRETIPCFGCRQVERSESPDPCASCMSKKPHKHFCPICEVEYDCTWAKEVPFHPTYGTRDIPCSKHTEREAFFFKKKDEKGRDSIL